MIESIVMLHFFGVIGGFITDKASVLSTVASALSAVAVAWFTAVLVHLARAADRNFRVTERAYVKLSHLPPGLKFSAANPGAMQINIRVKNFGRTPARTTAFCMQALVFTTNAEIPQRPRYADGSATGGFLVTDDHYLNGAVLVIKPEECAAVRTGAQKLLVFGYIDYLDQFGIGHRSGYGRVYDPSRDRKAATVSDEDFAKRTNLLFLDDPMGYNYDLPLSTRAWDEENPPV